ncbi:MAG: MCE family protein [Planctomycetes bacterium]|nr:MCE family protein [Planctomycetota bacterium]
MNERIVQFRVGVTMVAAAMIAVILVLLFDGFPDVFKKSDKTFYVAFDQAPGISEGTPVRRSGILIGRVSKVDFAEDLGLQPQDNARVIVTLSVYSNRVLRKNETPQIGKSILGGDSVIEFMLDVNKEDGNLVPEGNTILGKTIKDPFDTIGNIEQNLSIAIGSIAHTANEIGLLARRVNDLLANNDEQMIRIVGKAEATLDQLQIAVGGANELMNDPQMRENIRRTAADLPKALNEFHTSLAEMRGVFQSANRNIENLEGLTKPLGERGAELIDNLSRASARLDTTLNDVSAFAKQLNSREGTLGQLLNDDQLYQKLNTAVGSLSDISRELRPILHDTRVFTDKISRHPESLGVRGAIFPKPGVK